MQLVKKLLKNIGLLTVSDHKKYMEEFRFSCEEFSKDYLDASRGVTVGAEGGFIRGGSMPKGAVIIGSRVLLDGVMASHIVVAPWARKVSLSGIISTGKSAPKNTRAVARVRGSDFGDCAIENSIVGIN